MYMYFCRNFYKNVLSQELRNNKILLQGLLNSEVVKLAMTVPDTDECLLDHITISISISLKILEIMVIN